jgi:hypothetical protein
MKLNEIKDISGSSITMKDISQWGPEKLASMLEVDEKEIKSLTREELKIIISMIGKHDFVPDSKFDPKELAMGIEEEGEHTQNKIIAKLIAKDHLFATPNYYTELKKIENG